MKSFRIVRNLFTLILKGMNCNPDSLINRRIVDSLIKRGYKDIGWADDGGEFPYGVESEEELDLSIFANRFTHLCYINHTYRLILRVDMSD